MSPVHALLGLLVRDERHGYELKRIVDQEFAPFWRIDYAQLYRSLAKMQREGWVKARVEAGTEGPARKMYGLTARGRHAYSTWLTEPPKDRNEFFVKLRLANEAGLSVTHLVEEERRALEDERAARLESQRAARESGDASRLALANAAVRETEAMLVGLDLSTAIASPHGGHGASESASSEIVITGSDDPLVGYLAQLTHASTHAVGSIGGLLALAQHQTNAAGVHLLDVETGEYNVPFVKHLVPEDSLVLVNLAFRENGLMIAAGNPKNIRDLRDLTRDGVRFINRQSGAGTRLLLFAKLRAARINPHTLPDWNRSVSTHEAVADAIVSGAADAGPGLRAVAFAWGLDFIPLGEERYDLVIPSDEFNSKEMHPILDALDSVEFRRAASTLKGYDLTRTGRVVARVK
ncbi:MAG TPA: substrate-binding domain-containing protein [Anaerolineae bacterium]